MSKGTYPGPLDKGKSSRADPQYLRISQGSVPLWQNRKFRVSE